MPLVSSKQMLVRARKERYAVGAFNAENMEMVKAIISASEECLSPVIIQTTPSAIEYGGYDLFFAMVSSLAKHSKVDVALHLDHAETLESVIKAVKAGYTSVMIDGSKKTFIENIKITKQVVEYCHPLSIPVEAELGGIAGRVGFEHVDLSFTDPLIAEDFVNKTNVDSLAVAIGTVHGFYHSKPNLDFDRLKEISNRINIPIVLHGASGLSDEQIKKAVRFGVNKINIATELRTSFTSTIKEYFKVHDDVFDLRKYGKKAIESVQNVVKEKLLLLGSCGKCLSIKPKAFVFDLDGTIVDSEKYFFEAYKKAFLFYGFEIGDKALEFRSLDRELATKLCNSITSNTISYSIVRAKRNEILNLLIKETPIQLKKGIKEVLTWLKKRYQLFVISSSNLDRIKDILKGVGLLDLIDEVFSANEVKKGKPYPDIYNYFCKKKNLQPSDIVVVEDSPNGVKSAFDAGTNVIFVKDLTEPTSTIKEQCLACLSDIRLLMNII